MSTSEAMMPANASAHVVVVACSPPFNARNSIVAVATQ